ncbi:calcium-binding protein [Flaviflagellibacter deserti]|uniref:Calcium-binding protein n=1 Tax=Flaviflagellibacter deserti TaxID=2267266 RepID=A0ABV9Z7B8_9HYPH
MTISVKATKTDAANPTESRDRYLLKGAIFTKTPIYIGVLISAFLLYLKTFFPSMAEPAPPHEDKPAPQPDEDGAPVVETASVEGDGPVPEEEIPEEEPGPNSSGSPTIQSEDPSFVMFDSPPISYQVPDVAVRLRPDSYEVRPRAGNDNMGLARGNGGGNHSGGGGGGNGSSNPGDDGPGNGDDDDDDPVNRAPRSKGTAYLGDFVSGHAAVIAFAALLQNAGDPDGDRLSISNVSVSNGTLTAVNGGWIYTPAEGMTGFATLTYTISDGKLSVQHTAQFRVVDYHEINGTVAADALVGTLHKDQIDAGEGNDNVDARAGNDTIWAGGGDDHINAGSGDDIVVAGAGNDLIFAGLGNDVVWAGAGDDRVFGEEGDDVLKGEDGKDKLDGGPGDDTLDGGADDDELYAGADNDVLQGGTGDDLLRGMTGNDVLDGGADEDQVYGDEGDDVITGTTDAAADVYDGGDGQDTVDYSAAATGIILDLKTGLATGVEIGADLLANIEKVIAGDGDDVLRGDAEDNVLDGGGGNDTICDDLGSDTVYGGDGDDCIVAATDASSDVYDGGSGSDTVDYSAATMGILVNLDTGQAVGVEIGADLLRDIEEVMGGQGNDTFVLSDEPASLSGGGGDDEFDFSKRDNSGPGSYSIHDFDVGDRIRVAGYRISSEQGEGSSPFDSVYGDQSGQNRRQVRYQNERVDEMERTKIEADLDGDMTFELAINLDGHHILFIAENIS